VADGTRIVRIYEFMNFLSVLMTLWKKKLRGNACISVEVLGHGLVGERTGGGG